jgi:hypothetical protein
MLIVYAVPIPYKSSRHKEALSIASLDPLVHDASEAEEVREEERGY